VPTKLGSKNPKWITAMFVTNRLSGGFLGGARLQLVWWDNLAYLPAPPLIPRVFHYVPLGGLSAETIPTTS